LPDDSAGGVHRLAVTTAETLKLKILQEVALDKSEFSPNMSQPDMPYRVALANCRYIGAQ
jgi:hypothetical protein